MGDQRASIIDIDEEDYLLDDLVDVVKKPKPEKPKVNAQAVEAVAKSVGFTSRQQPTEKSIEETTTEITTRGTRIRHRRKKSPYTEQLGIKVRPGIREIFQDLGGLLSEYDHTTFERALHALIKQEKGTKELEKEFLELTKG